jgi:hypothetical protein
MRQLTWRAVIMGCVLGGVLSLTNLTPMTILENGLSR